ncbi:acyl-CoA dehydrogenase [Mangrovicoccus algicola]|uniref:3-methylmercaptopropionyl-CoA dehydrogenase n=1 Tax=Mangrovicoccus algicola TaxID=2771008 RepID=A0A8J7CID7_9RHOB|nr:acyl-CoA dehydrogenase [Mangrovicoccus algicola]MBE3639435.1 acyl-CoA dehydrogenase [Mangrovicoccus algicola]
MGFRAPVSEYLFLLDHVLGYDRVAAQPRFAEAGRDTAAAVLEEAGRLASEVLAPLQRPGDLTPARLQDGQVVTSPGFAGGYRAIAEGGWVGIAAGTEAGGMGLPVSLSMAVGEMMAGACLSLQLCPLLSQGQIEALEHHGSEALKALYLPRLVSGEWTGTMCLTEPQAGSDVGALTTRAEPAGDGSHRITGQKIYITWGDHDMAENICHLVLARLPDGGPGTKGISLFLVPKFLPDADGAPGAANAVTTVSLEHKLGLHGSPTAVLQFEAAQGWLVGAPHKGMAAMFTMMNNARLGVAMQGVGIAEAALQAAGAYAAERRQGETPEPGESAIQGHADLRRMLAEMQADTFAARAIALSCAVAIDMARATGDAAWAARAALLTPVAKSFGTETGMRVAETGVQVHGGMGVIEETGAAQFCRDVRVTAIYEGTNGIQAMDLAGRKLGDGGKAAFGLIDEIQDAAGSLRGRHPDLAGPVWDAAEGLREATERMLAAGLTDRFAVAAPYLRGFARVLGGWHHLQAGAAEEARLPLARFYIRRMLPEAGPLLAQAGLGAADLYAVRPPGRTV